MNREIPPNDTPTPQDVWEHPLTYHSEKVTTIGRSGEDHYLVYLPYKIEKFGWETGEDFLLLEKIEDDPTYIHGVEVSSEYDSHTLISSTKGVYKLVTQGNNRPRIRLPKMWADEFLNYGGDEALTVELNEVEGEPHIRIYESDDYEDRKDSLKAEDGPKMGPSRVLGPLGAAYGVSESISDTESLELDVPDRIGEGSVVPISVEVDLPELQEVLVQHRVQGEPGFTDIETASASNQSGNAESLPRPFKLDASYDLSEDEGAEIHEFRVRARYGDEETMNSEVQEFKKRE